MLFPKDFAFPNKTGGVSPLERSFSLERAFACAGIRTRSHSESRGRTRGSRSSPMSPHVCKRTLYPNPSARGRFLSDFWEETAPLSVMGWGAFPMSATRKERLFALILGPARSLCAAMRTFPMSTTRKGRLFALILGHAGSLCEAMRAFPMSAARN